MTEIFDAVFARGRAAEAVSGPAWLAALLRTEAALAQASADIGAVSREAADAVTAAAVPDDFDLAAVAASAAAIGNPVAGVVDRLRELVPEPHHAAIHPTATSQDMLDTAMMLVARDAVTAIADDLDACDAALADKLVDETWEDEPRMWGRTLLQHAEPITYANLNGMWAALIKEARDGLGRLEFSVSLSGPVGVRGGKPVVESVDLRAHFHRRLGLDGNPSAWHTRRGRVVRIGAAAAEAAGACAKVAVDVILLSQNEIGEIREGRPGGSTSMPHKRNPVAATCARACAARTPGLVATLYAAMPQELQRSPGLWHSEWETLSDLLRLTGSAAAWLRECLEGLEIDTAAMARNLKEAAG
ncbi:3-carboxy-cis,cis-muconate cycloisomerase [Glycomyces sambucus]|uniref:3-carboxy-cis,cis-muconate cycloisomerase n=1 Tax=Glycomyces sambucus TaxID=380244 RepID=A0A1G9LUY5_9ACTN|nr:lyase family protein [Glycomyces sambucus]SDL65759.1 3-carboxy-cis,cis-muconate cycloisomerase [Glycomyces sambucus]